MTREEKIARVEQYSVITFRNIHGKRAGAEIFGPTEDSRTKRFLGIPNYTKKQAEEATEHFLTKTSTVTLEDGHEINIKSEDGVDKAYWDMLKWNPKIQFSYKEAITNKVPFYIEVKELESKDDSDGRRLVHKAHDFVFNSTYQDLVFRARLLGMDGEDDTHEALTTMLCDIADTKPAKIIALYDSKISSIKMLFFTAIKYNVITKDALGSFKYGIHNLGSSEESAFMYLQHSENKELLKRLKSEINIVTDDMKKAEGIISDDSDLGNVDIADDANKVVLPKNFVQLKKYAIDVVGLSSERVQACSGNKEVITLIEDFESKQ